MTVREPEQLIFLVYDVVLNAVMQFDAGQAQFDIGRFGPDIENVPDQAANATAGTATRATAIAASARMCI